MSEVLVMPVFRSRYIIFTLCMIAVLLTGVATVQAQSSRIYFAGYMGLNTFSDSSFTESTTPRKGEIELKNSMSFAGALGLRINEQWRLEGEISYRNPDLNNIQFAPEGTFRAGGDLGTWLYMLNVYYDFDYEWHDIRPFLSAGFGLASHEGEIVDSSSTLPNATDDSIGFAWSVGGGLKYRFNPDVAITSSYRYIGTNDIEVDSFELDYTSHEIRLGLEYDLPMNWFE